MRVALAALGLLLVAPDAAAAGIAAAAPWWAWPLALFAVCFVLGVIAVPAGVGGGVLFVPIVSALFPFHIDFVRGAGLLLALASSLSSGPWLLRNGLANLRLALPLGLVASVGSIGGAFLGLALPARVVETALGVAILGIVLLMASSRGRARRATGRATASPRRCRCTASTASATGARSSGRRAARARGSRSSR